MSTDTPVTPLFPLPRVAPRLVMPPDGSMTGVSLFAGVGGIDLGLGRAGIRVVLASEIDGNAHAVLRWHFPHLVLHDDVTTLTGQQCLDAGLDPDNGVIAGGWPCQDLSTAGRRAGLAGERSGLFWHIPRLAAETNVAWLVGENVPGLLSSENGADFLTVCQAISDAGYLLDVELVDAQFFGVPQRRQRLYFVARRADLALGCGDPDSALVSARLVAEAVQGALVAGLGSGWDGYARTGPEAGFLSVQGVAARGALVAAAGRGDDWVGLVEDSLTRLGADREVLACGLAATQGVAPQLVRGGFDADGVVAASVVLTSLGRAVAGSAWAGPSWFGAADAIASALEEVVEYAGQQGGSLFDDVAGVHDWDPWRAEAGGVLDALRCAASTRGSGREVPAVTEGGRGDPDASSPAGSNVAAAPVGGVDRPCGPDRVAGGSGNGGAGSVSGREDEGWADGSGPVLDPGGRGGSGVGAGLGRVSAWPIQDGQAMTKAQNGLGVGDEGSPAYTLDTRGLQAVGVSTADSGQDPVEVDRGDDGDGPVSSDPVTTGTGTAESATELPVAVAFNQRDEARTSTVGYALQAQPGGDEQLVLAGAPATVPFRKSRRAANNTDDETWVHDPQRANTVNTFDVGDTRATELIVTGWCSCKRNRDDEWTEDGRHARCGLPTQGGVAVPLDLRSTGKNDSGGSGTSGDGIGHAGDPAPTLGVSSATPGVCVPETTPDRTVPVAFSAKDHGQDAGEVSPTLRAMGHTGSHANGGGQVGVVIPEGEAQPVSDSADGSQAFTSIEFGHYKPGVGTLKATDGRRPETHVVVESEPADGASDGPAETAPKAVVRRITPVEAERLQGFADGWTEVKASPTGVAVPQADSARYKQMGNAVAVPCVEWVGARVVAAHTGAPHPEVGAAGWPVGVDPVSHSTGAQSADVELDDDE